MKIVRIILFLIGCALIAVNISGFFFSLRNNSIYQEPKVKFTNDITLTEKEVLQAIAKDPSNIEDYLQTVNEAVNKGIAHYWLDQGIDTYHLRVPIYDNYLLFGLSYVKPDIYKKYEFCDFKKGIERGVGLCSQQAIIIEGILINKGIDSNIVGLDGHVVVQAQISQKDNQYWMLDPDYGVIIKTDIKEIENNPAIIRSYYSEKGYDDKTIEKLVKIYGKEGNLVYDKGVVGYPDCSGKKILIEKLSYIFIWLFPLLFILPTFMTFVKKINKK